MTANRNGGTARKCYRTIRPINVLLRAVGPSALSVASTGTSGRGKLVAVVCQAIRKCGWFNDEQDGYMRCMRPIKDDLSPDTGQWWRSIGESGFCGTDDPCSPEDFLVRLTGAVQHIGFDRWNCSAYLQGETTETTVVMGSDQPLSWLDRYPDKDRAIVRRVVQCAIKTSEPVLWTDETSASPDQDGSPDQIRGMNGGWSKSTHDACGIVSIFTVSRQLGSVVSGGQFP